MSAQKPSVGRIVLIKDSPSNGTDVHPAIINHVWSDTCVNMTVFPDCGQPYSQTSVLLHDGEASEQPTRTWMWPPRV